jgi:plastocyanin
MRVEQAPPPPVARRPGSAVRVLIPLGIALAVGLGIYAIAKSIAPDPGSSLFGKSGADTFAVKAALASGVLALAAFQLYTALWIFGKIHRRRALPPRLGRVHRLSGVAAILLSLPIAYNCIVTYGFESFNSRVLIHAAAGCFFYGAFAAKVFIVRSKRLPGWTLPVAGGTLIATIAVLWYTAAFWYYNDFKLPALSDGPPQASAAPGYGVAGGASAKPAPVKDGFVQVSYKAIQIDPAQITVKAGQKIKWTNLDPTRHNVISQDGSTEKVQSPDFDKGGTFVYAPKKPGVINYICTFHPSSMIGTIKVMK